MLRSLSALTAAALLLAGCGDDDDPAPAPAQRPGISGTLFGQPFTPVDATALLPSGATCTLLGVTANATALVIGFGSFQGMCSFVTQTALCGERSNATIATLALVRANVVPGGTAAPIGPGTYPVTTGTPVPDAQGNVTFAQAVAVRNDATCGGPADVEATAGTIRIDTVTPRITGSADLTLEGGGRLAGAFDVPVCGFQTDVCTLLEGGVGGNCDGAPPCL